MGVLIEASNLLQANSRLNQRRKIRCSYGCHLFLPSPTTPSPSY